MSDDQTHPIDPESPTPPPQSEAHQPLGSGAPTYAGQPPYAMPLPAGYPAYPAQQRPRFIDQVLGMRAVVAVALACLIIGGMSGWILGRAAGSDGGRFGNGPGFIQRGPVPDGSNGFSNQAPQPFRQGQSGR